MPVRPLQHVPSLSKLRLTVEWLEGDDALYRYSRMKRSQRLYVFFLLSCAFLAIMFEAAYAYDEGYELDHTCVVFKGSICFILFEK